ncbi:MULTISPECIES: Abi family protein [Rothia]|uniref:Abi family protein n=1 Tax=Rothia TaxID=32207 RepID=UPI00114CB4A4
MFGSTANRSTAEYMGVNHKHFEGRLRSLTTLRNRVAHGSRLWMMPTTDTSAKPKIPACLGEIESAASPLVEGSSALR